MGLMKRRLMDREALILDAQDLAADKPELVLAAAFMLEALTRIRSVAAFDAHDDWYWRTAEQAIAKAEGRGSTGPHLPGESVLPGSYGEDGRQ